jgi:hypothetical protein
MNEKTKKIIKVAYYSAVLIVLIGLFFYGRNYAEPCDICHIELRQFEFGRVTCREFATRISRDYSCVRTITRTDGWEPISISSD